MIGIETRTIGLLTILYCIETMGVLNLTHMSQVKETFNIKKVVVSPN